VNNAFWVLEVLGKDGNTAQRLVLTPDMLQRGITLGRAIGCDVVLDDIHAAPQHAVVTLQDVASTTLTVKDLGSINALIDGKGKRRQSLEISSSDQWRIGLTAVRIRHTSWALEPERKLSSRWIWVWACLAALGVLGRTLYETWIGDVGQVRREYLYAAAGALGGLAAWSGIYALLGRIMTGVDRFFSHLLIAAVGLLLLSVVAEMLELLAFSASWLWPMQISAYVTVVMVALLVRQHLRLADPQHWPYSRYAVAAVAVLAIAVPIAQNLISHGVWTTTQSIQHIEHPALRLATPVPTESYTQRRAGFSNQTRRTAHRRGFRCVSTIRGR
jgi:FHA domain